MYAKPLIQHPRSQVSALFWFIGFTLYTLWLVMKALGSHSHDDVGCCIEAQCELKNVFRTGLTMQVSVAVCRLAAALCAWGLKL